MPRWWGQLKEIWDLAGQLVELRGRIDEIVNAVQGVIDDVRRIDERTRKQVYREKKDDEHAVWQQQQPAVPEGARSQLLRAARAKGLLR